MWKVITLFVCIIYTQEVLAVQKIVQKNPADFSNKDLCPVGQNGLQPHPSDCTLFVNCHDGIGYIEKCAAGTVFSIPNKACSYKENVDCTGRNAEKKISCRPGALYPHSNDCTKFLRCNNDDQTYILDCGNGTAFDSERLVCDYKDKVKCCSTCTEIDATLLPTENISEEAIPLTSLSPSPTSNTQHSIYIVCPSGVFGYFPYPFDYTKYMDCRGNRMGMLNCAENTAFSISKSVCISLDEIDKSDHVLYNKSENYSLDACPPGTVGKHLHPFNASLYVECKGNQMKVKPCNNGYVFSFTQSTCLPGNRVLIQQRVR